MKYWCETKAVAQRILIQLWRNKLSLIFWCIFPISLLLLNGYMIADGSNISLGEAIQLAAPSTLVGAALFFSCLGGTLATIVAEREQQTLKRLFISPLSGISYFLGIFFAYSLIAFAQSIIVFSFAASMGANFEGSLFWGLAILILSIIAYVGLGFFLGTQLGRRIEDVNTLVATFGIPLLMTGGAFFPSSYFPKQLLELANYNPIFHMIEAMVAVWVDGESLSQFQGNFSFLLTFSFLMVLVGWLSYQKMLRREMKL